MDIYYLMRSLHSLNLLEDQLTKQLVDYIVKRGYDSDDLLAMSSRKGGYRRAVNMVWLISEAFPSLKNKHFLTHI